MYHVFNDEFDSGLIVRKDEERMSIKICKHKPILLTFEIFKKYKRIPYYSTQLLLDNEKPALTNQYEVSRFILEDNILLPFF